MTLDELLEQHIAYVEASSIAWTAMCQAQNASRAARDAERASAERIEKFLQDNMISRQTLHKIKLNPQFKPVPIEV
jgi:hypothetical protein